METLFFTLLLGGIVGGILGLTGAGGSIVAVPLLMFFLHLSPLQAAPIALLAVSLSTSTATLIALKAGTVRYRAAGLIAITGVAIAPIGVWCAQRLPTEPLTLLFAVVLIYVGLRMLKQTKDSQTISSHALSFDLLPCQVTMQETRITWNMRCARALSLTGVLTGFLSGLLGVGGGFVVVPALRKYSNVPMPHIMPTSLSVIALVSTTGVISALLLGHIDWKIAMPFTLGAFIGMLICKPFSQKFSSQILQRTFAYFSLMVAISLILKIIIGGHLF